MFRSKVREREVRGRRWVWLIGGHRYTLDPGQRGHAQKEIEDERVYHKGASQDSAA